MNFNKKYIINLIVSILLAVAITSLDFKNLISKDNSISYILFGIGTILFFVNRKY